MSEIKHHDGELVGWRSWRIDYHGNLSGLHGHWRPGANKALCFSGHVAPVESCSCGYYGAYDHRALPFAGLTGLILVWGTIARQPTEFRAEWAEPLCLIAPMTPEVKRAAEYYEIPIFPDSDHATAWATKERGFEFIRRPESQIKQFRFRLITEHRVAKEEVEKRYVPRHSSTLSNITVPFTVIMMIGVIAGFILAAVGH